MLKNLFNKRNNLLDNNSLKQKKWNPQYAMEDIECYKFFLQDNDGIIYFPFVHQPIDNIGIGSRLDILHKHSDIDLKVMKIQQMFKPYYEITSGFFHSELHKMDLKCYHSLTKSGKLIQYKCIIPKGTLFFKADMRSSHYESADELASESLIIVGYA